MRYATITAQKIKEAFLERGPECFSSQEPSTVQTNTKLTGKTIQYGTQVSQNSCAAMPKIWAIKKAPQDAPYNSPSLIFALMVFMVLIISYAYMYARGLLSTA